ncbi:MAG: DNA primase [Planctomycetota bacterium]|nr:MAG: DNA primase [Planctomycetota bacterium]
MPLGPYSDAKEQIRQAVNIVDLVESYFPLRRQGRNFVGLCPWHDDHRPSLQVNPERQTFRCWVCDIGGDIFTFVMRMENVEFPEALAILAERAGIDLKPRQSGGAPGEKAPVSRKQLMYRAAAWAEAQYHQCLLESPEAEPARRYLAERQIPEEFVRRFRLGFSPVDPEWIYRKALAVKANPKVLEAIGVLARSERGVYDRFRGRLLFSIRNPQGKPVGFGGRVLPELGTGSPAKYVNSPETPLFAKSRLLYGLDLARETMRKTGTALVMEGYTDVIMAHRFGFTNAVAVLGTALGNDHIRLLNRYADRVVLILDGDEAGRRRTNEVLSLFVARGVDIRVLTLPEGLDPCDFLLEHGAEAFQRALENDSRDALDHAFVEVTRGVDLVNDIPGVTKAIDQLLTILAQAPQAVGETTAAQQAREWKILSRLAVQARIDEDILRRRLKELRRGRRNAPADRTTAATKPGAKSLPPLERDFLELLLAHPDIIAKAIEVVRPEDVTAPVARRIYQAALELHDRGEPVDFDRLMLSFDDPETKNLLVELDETVRTMEMDSPNEVWLQWAAGYQAYQANKEREALENALRSGSLDDEAEREALRRLVEQQRNRQRGTSEPTEG